MRINLRLLAVLAAVVIALVGLGASLYVVPPARTALLLRGGKVVAADVPSGPHWKVPLLESVVILDARVQLTSGRAELNGDAGGDPVGLGYSVAWRIADPSRYYQAAGDDVGVAGTRLSDALERYLRAQVTDESPAAFVKQSLPALAGGARKALTPVAQKLGVTVLSVQTGPARLPSAMQQRIGAQMAAATQSRAAAAAARGARKADDVRQAAAEERQKLLAAAHDEAAQLRGASTARAASIYAAEAQKAPEFFAYFLQLEDARRELTDHTRVLVISADSPWFRALKPGAATAPKR